MTGYELSRKFFDFSFENPEKIKPAHVALYFFIIDLCNRLGWKEKFGLPTSMAKDAIGIRSYNTYIHTLHDLIEWKFITMIEVSKNQYSSNIIALSKFDKATNKAIDKALTTQMPKQSESTCESIDSIDKPINQQTKKQGNKETTKENAASKESLFSDENSSCSISSRERIDYQFFVNKYHELCGVMPKVEKLTETRKKVLKYRLKEHGQETILKVLEAAGKSDFLNGRTDNAFYASFDWIFKPTNFIKILEGNYKNRSFFANPNDKPF